MTIFFRFCRWSEVRFTMRTNRRLTRQLLAINRVVPRHRFELDCLVGQLDFPSKYTDLMKPICIPTAVAYYAEIQFFADSRHLVSLGRRPLLHRAEFQPRFHSLLAVGRAEIVDRRMHREFAIIFKDDCPCPFSLLFTKCRNVNFRIFSSATLQSQSYATRPEDYYAYSTLLLLHFLLSTGCWYASTNFTCDAAHIESRCRFRQHAAFAFLFISPNYFAYLKQLRYRPLLLLVENGLRKPSFIIAVLTILLGI